MGACRTAHVVTCATDVRQNIARSGAKFYQSEKEYFAERHRKLGEQLRGKRADGAIADGDGEEEIQLKRSSTSRDVKQIFGASTPMISSPRGLPLFKQRVSRSGSTATPVPALPRWTYNAASSPTAAT